MRYVKPLQPTLVFGRKENSVLELLDDAVSNVFLGVSDVVEDADGLAVVRVAQVSCLAAVAVEGLLVLH